MSWVKNLIVSIFQSEYVTTLNTKALSEVGGISGIILSITINWGHIYEKGIETLILTLIGGFGGSLGGLLFAITKKKITKYLEDKEQKEKLEKELDKQIKDIIG